MRVMEGIKRMKWVKEDIQHNKQVWYSEDEVKKYICCLAEIKELVQKYNFQYEFANFKSRIFREINEVDNESSLV